MKTTTHSHQNPIASRLREPRCFKTFDKNPMKEPEDFFGPNIGRLYGWISESDKKSIMEADILPASDLSPNDLFYSLYNYEELEKAVTVLQGKATQDDRKGYNIDHQIRYNEG